MDPEIDAAPLGPDGRTVGEGDIGVQLRRCLDISAEALAAVGAGDRAVVHTPLPHFQHSTVELLAERLQPLHRLGLQSAIGQFLDAIGDTAFKVAAVERRRLAVEQVPPLLLQVVRRRRLQRR